LQSLRPEKVSVQDWEALSLRSPLAHPAQPCKLDSETKAVLERVFEAATMCDMDTMKDDCHSMLQVFAGMASRATPATPEATPLTPASKTPPAAIGAVGQVRRVEL